MGRIPQSNFGKFQPERLDLETAMTQISERFPISRDACLLVIVNGAGLNAGKTTVSGEISIGAKRQAHPSLIFEGNPDSHVDTLRALAQMYSNGPVLVKITEYAGKFDANSGQRMRDHVVKISEDEASDLLAKAGIEADIDLTLVVNVSSPLAKFPLNHLPADLEIFNQEAVEK